MRRLLITCVISATACTHVPVATEPAGPPPPSRILAEFSGLTTAIRAGDFRAGERHLDSALVYAPGHPLVIEQLMRVRARLRDSAGVLRALRELAPIGSTRPVRGDSIYAFMRPNAELDSLSSILEARSQPLIASDTAVVIAEEDLLIESIAVQHQPNSPPDLLLGSMRTGRVVAVPLARTGDSRTVANLTGRVLGMKLDAQKRLWTNVWFPTPPADSLTGRKNRSELAILSLSSGKPERVFASQGDESAHLFNDVDFDARYAYLTDTEANRLYRVTRDLRDATLTPFGARSAEFTSPNGVAVSADRRLLYVAHIEGISAWSIATQRRALVRSVRGLPTSGIDGLYVCGRALIAVQNVLGIDRVTWFDLSADGLSIVGGRVLEQRHPAYRQPTTGVVNGNHFLYIASSDVARQRAAGPLLPPNGQRNTVILRLKLPRACR